MKNMKNLIRCFLSVFLSLVLCAGMAVPAFAADETESAPVVLSEENQKPEEPEENKDPEDPEDDDDDDTPPYEEIRVSVKWVDEDGTTLLDGAKSFSKGETEPTTNVIPTKNADEDYTYEFYGWERSEDEDSNVTYRAIFTAKPKNTDPVDPVDPVDPDPDPVIPDPVIPDPVIPDPDPVDPDPDPVDIEDPDVPLEELPDEDVEIEDPEVPLEEAPEEIELDDPDVPLADVPQTGDNSQIWVIFAVISGAGLVWLALEDKKRKSMVK